MIYIEIDMINGGGVDFLFLRKLIWWVLIWQKKGKNINALVNTVLYYCSNLFLNLNNSSEEHHEVLLCPVPSSFIKLITIMRMLWVPWKVHNKFIMKWKRKLIFWGFLKLKFADFLSMPKSSFTVIYRNKIFTRNLTHNKQKMSWQ